MDCFNGSWWGLLGQKGTTFPSFSPFRAVTLKELGPYTRKVQLRAPSPHCHGAVELREPAVGADREPLSQQFSVPTITHDILPPFPISDPTSSRELPL